MNTQQIKRKHTSGSHGSSLSKTARFAAIGLLITLSVAAALMLAGAAISMRTPDPAALADPIGYVSLFISAFLGGFACPKLNRGSAYPSSLLCGTLFVLLSMLFSAALPHSLSSGEAIPVKLALHAASLLTFPLGTFVGIKASAGKRRTPHRRKK